MKLNKRAKTLEIMLRQKVTVNQPRIKADKTGTISVSTLLEVSEKDYNFLNGMAYDKEEAFLIIVKDEDYIDFILNEATRLAEVPAEEFVIKD